MFGFGRAGPSQQLEATSTSERKPATSLAPNTTSTACRRREEVDSEVGSEV